MSAIQSIIVLMTLTYLFLVSLGFKKYRLSVLFGFLWLVNFAYIVIILTGEFINLIY